MQQFHFCVLSLPTVFSYYILANLVEKYKSLPPIYRFRIYSVSYENEMKEDGKVNRSDGRDVYFVELSVSACSGTKSSLDHVSHDSFPQSHRMLFWSMLGPGRLVFQPQRQSGCV